MSQAGVVLLWETMRVRRLEAGEWLVRIEGALSAYISVKKYERNLARLAANRARAES